MFRLKDGIKISKRIIRNVYDGNKAHCHYSLENSIKKMIDFELNRFDDSYTKKEIKKIIINNVYEELKEYDSLSEIINYTNRLRIEPQQHIY